MFLVRFRLTTAWNSKGVFPLRTYQSGIVNCKLCPNGSGTAVHRRTLFEFETKTQQRISKIKSYKKAFSIALPSFNETATCRLDFSTLVGLIFDEVAN